MASDGDKEREDQGKDSRRPCVASIPSANSRGSRLGLQVESFTSAAVYRASAGDTRD